MRHTGLQLDQVFGIDKRCLRALAKLGVFVNALETTPEGPLRGQISFTFTGDRELAKYHVSTFLADEYNATNVQFFASVRQPTRCYAYFTYRSGK